MNNELKNKLDNIKNEGAYKRFIELLNQIFELDKGDLDFGIYRILNYRRKEIEDFLNGTGSYDEKGLPQQIIEALDSITQEDKTSIKKEIDELTKQLEELGSNPNENKKIKELKQKLEKGTDLTSLQIEIYNNLYEFFSRYYDEGDFISKRRYKKDVYAIPYNGEEVKLTWANEDQYYIKTATNFNNYVFKVNDIDFNEWKINFKVVNANVEKNNNKENKKRVFMLYDESFDSSEEKRESIIVDKNNKEIIINFIYDYPLPGYEKDVSKEDGNSKVDNKNYEKNKCYIDIKNKLSKDKSLEMISMVLFDKNTDNNLNLIGKNFIRFFAKNQFDFFIHKDLKGFLNRELDFYIKTEIMNLDDIEDNTNENDLNKCLIKIKVIKKIAKTIINFLYIIEDFQKKMYLKKKFIVNTDYIITIDNILDDNELIKEVLKNKEQLKEWEDYYDLKDILNNISLENNEHLNAIKYLPVDTKYFDNDFKEKLLSSISDFDNKTNGLLVNGDNFQGLRLFYEKYYNTIKTCYIDPPYNTTEDTFLYKDNYKSSTWISFIVQTIKYLKRLLEDFGCIFTSIDENQVAELKMIYDEEFGVENFVSISPRKTRGSATTKSEAELQKLHDYIVCYWRTKKGSSFNLKINGVKKYPYYDNRGKYYVVPLQDNGPHGTRTARPNLYYPIYVDAKGDLHLENNNKNYIQVLPSKHKNDDGGWMWSKKRFESQSEDLVYIDNTIKIKHYYNANEDQNKYVMHNQWLDMFQNAKGTNILNDILGKKGIFSNPKPVELISHLIGLSKNNNKYIIDYFAGSGTTGHAVIDLNREDDGNRKYILVEMGEYFDTVLIPRIKKVVYCNDWKDGKPKNRTTGVSQIIKYQNIESYEDTLNNIANTNLVSYISPNCLEYSLNLNDDYLLNNKVFEKPFECKMNIQINNEIKNVNIDLVETFNYLIGLYVDKSFITKVIDKQKYKLIVGNLRTGERVAVIWRDIDNDVLKSNKLLNEFVNENIEHLKDAENIYINGDVSLDDTNLNNKIILIEEQFKKEMFNYEEI